MMTFQKYLLKLEAGEAPPAPPGGDLGGAPAGGGSAPPPPGGDPMAGGMGGGMGGDPMGGGAPGGAAGPRKAINVTTVWDAIREVLGKDAHKEIGPKKHSQPSSEQSKDKKKPKSLMQ